MLRVSVEYKAHAVHLHEYAMYSNIHWVFKHFAYNLLYSLNSSIPPTPSGAPANTHKHALTNRNKLTPSPTIICGYHSQACSQISSCVDIFIVVKEWLPNFMEFINGTLSSFFLKLFQPQMSRHLIHPGAVYRRRGRFTIV